MPCYDLSVSTCAYSASWHALATDLGVCPDVVCDGWSSHGHGVAGPGRDGTTFPAGETRVALPHNDRLYQKGYTAEENHRTTCLPTCVP